MLLGKCSHRCLGPKHVLALTHTRILRGVVKNGRRGQEGDHGQRDVPLIAMSPENLLTHANHKKRKSHFHSYKSRPTRNRKWKQILIEKKDIPKKKKKILQNNFWNIWIKKKIKIFELFIISTKQILKKKKQIYYIVFFILVGEYWDFHGNTVCRTPFEWQFG